ncbi:uncharacterized protein LOC110374347 isoform X1 [Helicoverpa armigera]|uniref:uncharacterized protein LOC110374347 isoform X1 n=1 Tax=Helicoverpa armigera TaxID=29058 RepID=UPI003083129B
MATSKYLFALAVLVASSYAAPNHEPIPLKIPDECKGKGFCPIKPEGYDAMEKFITHLLTDKFIAQSMGDRNGIAVSKEELSPEEDWHNCPYRKTVQSMYTYSLSNETNDFDYIIQHKLLTQPIEIVTCATEKIKPGSSEECFQDIGLSSFKMKSMCQTTTSKRSLLVYDYKTGQIKKKPFDVPCCCSCVVSETV